MVLTLFPRHSRKVLAVFFFASGLCMASAKAQWIHVTKTLAPTADAYVNSNTADDGRNVNHGAETGLRFRYSQSSTSTVYNLISFLKFSLKAAAIPSNAIIDSVELRGCVYYAQSGSGQVWHLLRVASNAWKEDSITWDNKPAIGSDTIARVTKPTSGAISSDAPYYASWTGLGSIVDSVRQVDSMLSIALYTRLNTAANTTIYSREWPDSSQRPLLRIHYSIDTSRQYAETRKHNLNLIYFLPTDVDTVANYRQRLNGIMLQAQNFYRKWMTYWGYTGETFGLQKDSSGLVKWIVLHGQYDKTHYPYDGGGSNIIPEVNAYFTAHPEDKSSTHTLVILPQDGYNPFYGLGNGWCFALDNPNIDTTYSGSSNYIGGLVHELGHGLNLPHDKEKKTEKANPAMGTSLMGSGNTTYDKSATFMTAAACAIEHNCEVFRTEDSIPGLYGGGTASFTSFRSEYSGGYIHLSGRYTSSTPINNIIAYNDQDDDGANYDQLAWVTHLEGTDSFYVDMPVSEFWKKYSTYTLRMRLLFANGSTKDITYPYYFSDSLPVIDINFGNLSRESGLYPVADTYIRSGSYANTNYGTDSTLVIKPDPTTGYKREAFLKFRLSDYAGTLSNVTFVRLGIKVRSANSSSTATLLSVRMTAKANWDNTAANSLTWNKWLSDSSHIDSLTAGYLYGGNWMVWDINKDTLLQHIHNGDSVLVFHVTSSYSGSSVSTSDISFYSMESSDTSDRPYLLLTENTEGNSVMSTKNTSSLLSKKTIRTPVMVLFPNPARTTLTVRSAVTSYGLIIRSNGQVVRQVSLQSGADTSVDVSRLAPGMYYLTTENGSYKFFVAR